MKNVCQQRNVNFTTMFITRFFILVITLGLFNVINAKDFPVSNYSYAKVYLLNLDWQATQTRPNQHVFNGSYAITKEGEGYTIPNKDLQSILETVNELKEEMHTGLSKCFIARHGVIFYNSKHEPVASMSICFECERLTTWDNDSSYYDEKIGYPKFSESLVKKTEKGFKYMKHIFQKNEIPVFKYDELDQYKKVFPKDTIHTKISMKKMPLVTESIKYNDVKKWFTESKEIKESVDTKFTAGGDRFKFKKIKYLNSNFLFFDENENPKLAEATIVDPLINTVFGLRIGQSIDEINNLKDFELSNKHDEISIDAEDIRLILHFKNNTLIKLEIRQY